MLTIVYAGPLLAINYLLLRKPKLAKRQFFRTCYWLFIIWLVELVFELSVFKEPYQGPVIYGWMYLWITSFLITHFWIKEQYLKYREFMKDYERKSNESRDSSSQVP